MLLKEYVIEHKYVHMYGHQQRSVIQTRKKKQYLKTILSFVDYILDIWKYLSCIAIIKNLSNEVKVLEKYYITLDIISKKQKYCKSIGIEIVHQILQILL